MLRFNRQGDFNLPVGNVDFNNNVKDAIEDYFISVKGKDVCFSNKKFEEFLNGLKLTDRDFVYLDPPYLITESEYNKIWDEADERSLLEKLDELNRRNVKFAISNVTHYRGRVNNLFMEWSQRYRAVPIKSNYINYHDNSEKVIKEVLVVNY